MKITICDWCHAPINEPNDVRNMTLNYIDSNLSSTEHEICILCLRQVYSLIYDRKQKEEESE